MRVSELRKAAILLMSLPERQAVQLLGKLNPQQIEQVSREIMRMGTISGTDQEAILKEFGEFQDSVSTNSAPLIKAAPFSFLRKVDSPALLTAIINEHPQTIALILCHARPEQVSKVIHGLPPARQFSVIRRIATMGQASLEAIDAVAQELEHRIARMTNPPVENRSDILAAA